MMPVILAVHFPAKKLAKLRMAAMRLGAKVRVVEKWEYLNAVGARAISIALRAFMTVRISPVSCSSSRIFQMRS